MSNILRFIFFYDTTLLENQAMLGSAEIATMPYRSPAWQFSPTTGRSVTLPTVVMITLKIKMEGRIRRRAVGIFSHECIEVAFS